MTKPTKENFKGFAVGCYTVELFPKNGPPELIIQKYERPLEEPNHSLFNDSGERIDHVTYSTGDQHFIDEFITTALRMVGGNGVVVGQGDELRSWNPNPIISLWLVGLCERTIEQLSYPKGFHWECC